MQQRFGGRLQPTGTPSLPWSCVVVIASLLAGASIVHNLYKPDLAMITGDQALTACHVASQLHIVSKPALILGNAKSGDGYEWISPDEAERIDYM